MKCYDLDKVVYATLPFPVELELASSREASILALDWLPQKTVKVAPKVSFNTEIESSGNGSFRLMQTDYNVDKSKSTPILGGQTRRPNGMFAEAGGVALGFSFSGGPLTATWDAKELRWKFHSVTFGIGISGKCETPPYYWLIPPAGPTVYLKVDAEASISAQCEISGFGSQNGLDATLKLSSDKFPAVTITGGAGVYNKINVEGALSGEFPIEVACNNGDWSGLRYGIRDTCRLTGQILVFKATLYEWNSPTIWLIDNANSAGSGGGGRGAKSMRLMSSAQSSDIEWQLQSRDYLKKETPRMRLMAAAPTDGVV